MTYVKHTSTY